jgi:hypothetical protein
MSGIPPSSMRGCYVTPACCNTPAAGVTSTTQTTNQQSNGGWPHC